MNFNLDGSLKNAIVQAAALHSEGETFDVGRFKARMCVEASSYVLANIKLEDGRVAQAQIKITCDPDDFIEPDGLFIKIDMEKEVAP